MGVTLSWADLKASLNSMTHKFLDSHRVWGDSFSKNLIWFPLNWEARDLRRKPTFVYTADEVSLELGFHNGEERSIVKDISGG